MSDSSHSFYPKLRGRGALKNPAGRFEHLDTEMDADAYEAMRQNEDISAEQQIRTAVYKDTSKTIISTNESPDVGMETTVNPYRGCEHGCIYCYARPTHEYLGMSAGVDFETKIFAKPNAPDLLIEKLRSKTWQPKIITFSGITDPYQPQEKHLKITRGCLEVLRDFKNPAGIITKNYMVTRDIDILQDMARDNTIVVNMSITTMDSDLARRMEPRTSRPGLRFKAIEELSKAGIPVGIMMGPVIPGLTDQEIPSILKAASDAGARNANYTMLRLPYGVKDLFQDWLAEHYPNRVNKILNRVRDMRGGRLNDSEFGLRMRGQGVFADQVATLFTLYKKKYGLNRPAGLSIHGFDRGARDNQYRLF